MAPASRSETLRALPVLVGLARARPLHFLGSSLGVFANYLLILLPGLIMQAYFNDISDGRPAGANVYTLIALLAAVAVGNGIQGMASALEMTLRMAASVLIRRNLLTQVLHRPTARGLPGSTGEAIGRLRDDVQAASEALTFAMDPMGMVVMVVIAVVTLARVSVLITVIVVLPSLAAMLMVNVLRRRISSFREAAQQSGADVTGMISETFSAFATIKGAGAEERIAEHFTDLCAHRLRAVRRDTVLTQVIDSMAVNLSNIAVGCILLLVPRALHQGSFTVGDFALFISYLTQLATVTGYVGEYSVIYRQLMVSLRRLQPLLSGGPGSAMVEPHSLKPGRTRPDAEDVSGLPLRSLSARGLTHVHPGGRGLLGVDLEVPGGSLTVVTGRIGSGKTTLLRCLLGLLPAQEGEIRWNGEPVEHPDRWMVPPRCAFTPQVPRLFTASVEENILMGRPGGQALAMEAARTAVLASDLEQLDQGLETAVGPRGMRLSGGQLQRVAAARMIARGAALMVFDDLSSALDTVTEAELWRRLRADHPEATLLAVSHRPAVLELADQVIRLENGRVADRGGMT
ncbi:MAG TPA: ABC transporter ATP-binding protein [Candidatus Dormibacteraeota bacterium]|jgi:ATP-binding cassette subfamily B protein|nr:ABC transporter ATP-binding protein [Candidatus Dormibacteraeota bacterium]